ncbi:hypothetical protein [Hymenobacter chitinivorans]|uniref:Uncharacterized protein n=1 Tax=Hymenobacter chitinivorans DSM 11115 TaxID=1121954 RepID=A0A2M9BMV9_9BACT|nr:hypothetical protein [Hymenobacter chitinivorans]PJJ59287.1 hypothetical protein CLV45_0703 [Hymenobacter chitinivorans DSM 11115]
MLVRFGLGFMLTVVGYFFWQVIAAFAAFFTIGSGGGHRDEALVIEAGFLAVHVALLSGLAWRRVLYTPRWVWALNVGVSVGFFAYTVFVPWYSSPRDPAYQYYTFFQEGRRYEISLQKPGNSFDLLDVTDQNTAEKNDSTVSVSTSLLYGDYQVRHDTIFLRQRASPRQCFIYHGTLVGFGNSTMPIPLIREQDSKPWSLQ